MKEKVALLPTDSGIYQFLDESGRVIYVGKAKNLRSRVSSYFNSSRDHTPKVRALVRHIADLRHVVVNSEQDALLLENNLIKELQPRYNILLKDAKSYPWIVITHEAFPRVISTRRLERDRGEYFGPYSSVGMQRAILELVREIYPLRTCKLNLEPAAIARGKYAVCLKYHMGHCMGGCVGRQSAEDYQKYIDQVREILRGSLGSAREYLRTHMASSAEALRFEEAEGYKKKLAALEEYSSRSVVVSPTLGTLDVVNLVTDDKSAYCNHLRVVNGAIIGSYTFELVAHLDENPQEVLAFAMMYLTLEAPQTVVPFMPSEFTDRCFVPQRGDKVRLLELSAKNCTFFRLEKLKNLERKDPELNVSRIMQNMQRELALSAEPRHIECFDNSNLQGTYPVASCVVFRDGKPAKRDYRHFNIKTVIGANDFASMQEVVGRRYKRMLDEGLELPQLIVVDGGKGQLSAAYETLCELGIEDRIKIVGLAKRLEEVFFVGDPTPHYLDKKGETLRILMHLRDEAHRFGITFHRNKRSKGLEIKN